MGDGSLMCHSLVRLAANTPNMMGKILRICFPVALKPTMVKMPPMVGPFKSPFTAATNKVANKPFTPILITVAGLPHSFR